MTKSPFKVYPWPSLDAFEQVVFLLNRTDSESIDAADLEHLVELTWARDQMIAWKNKFHNQHYHELNATCALLNAFCAEIRLKLTRRFRSNQSNKNYHEDDQSLILDQEIASICSGASQQDLCSLYGISLLEFFKMLAYYEVTSTGKIAKTSSRSDSSVVKIAEQIKIPPYIVEYRHRIAHSASPSFTHLKNACLIALGWLKEYYWDRVLLQQQKGIASFQNTLDRVSDLIMKISYNRKYKRTTDGSNRSELDDQDKVTQLQRCFNASGHFCSQTLAKCLIDAIRADVQPLKLVELEKSLSNKFEAMQCFVSVDQEADVSNHTEFQCRINYISKDVFDRFTKVLSVFGQLSQSHHYPMLMSSLLELFDHSDHEPEVRTAAIIWFAQIQIALLRANDHCSTIRTDESTVAAKKKSKKRSIQFSSTCLCQIQFDQSQSRDCRWMHVFMRLIDQPSIDRISFQLARHFWPFVQHAITNDQFERIVQLNGVYVGVQTPIPTTRSDQVLSLQTLIKSNQISCRLTSDIDWPNVAFGSHI